MKTIYCFLAFAALAFAQPTGLRVEGVTSTQVVISYVPPSASACTLSTASSANDVNGTLFSGSNSDSGRAVTVGNRRFVVLGTRRAQLASTGAMVSRAFPADTDDTVTVNCSGAASVNFHTAQINSIAPDDYPFSADGDGNLGYGDFGADRSIPTVDPLTGAKLYQVTSPQDYAAISTNSFTSGVYFGGAGWTSPGNITSGGTSNLAVSPSGTGAITLPMRLSDKYVSGFSNLENDGNMVDAGLNVWGAGSDGTASNRQIEVCLSVDSGQSCYTPKLTIDLPQTTAASRGTFPTTFPTAGAANATWTPFVGWGKVIPKLYYAYGSSLSATAGVATIAGSFYGRGLFQKDWATGSKVYVAGSDPTCPSNYCTIASVDSETQITFSESLSISGAAWEYAGVTFRINKKTSTGTVSISASWKLAKSWTTEAGADFGCSSQTVTANVDRDGNPISPGVVGRLCVFNRFRAQTPGMLYFVGENTPDFRLLSLGRAPDSPPVGYDSSQDWAYFPSPINSLIAATPTIFDPVDPTTIYAAVSTNDGHKAIFKGVYSGDFRETTGLHFAASNDTGLYTYVDDGITWTNLTRASTGNDLRTKILAGTSYNESLYGSLVGSELRFSGFAEESGTLYASFYKLFGSQNEPCAIFTFNASTGALAGYFNTVTGSGVEGQRWGSCHSVGSQAGRVMLADNGVYTGGLTGTPYAGPFQATPTHVKKSGVMSTNTSLPATYDGSYDGGCDSDIAQEYKDLGATGNRCVTLRFSTEPCSSNAGAAEKAATPCPGDATKSYIGVNVAPGDEFHDATDYDTEHFLVVKRTAVSGNTFDVQVMRDSADSYCCRAARDPVRCLGTELQATHANGWTLYMTPRGSCQTATRLIKASDVTDVRTEIIGCMRGHFKYEKTAAGIQFLGFGVSGRYCSRPNATLAEIGTYNNIVEIGALAPSFGGITLDATKVQSYANAGLAGIGVDWRHLNGSTGTEAEVVDAGNGPTLTITAVVGQSNTYKVTGFATYYPKQQPLLGWAGPYLLQNQSTAVTGNTISDANPYKYCYAYRANECRTGSSAGDLYVVVPNLNTSVTQCNANQTIRRSICIFPYAPAMASVIQVRSSQSDVTASQTRIITNMMATPGSQYAYSHASPFSTTQSYKVFATAFNLNGLTSSGVLVDPGRWEQKSTTASQFVQIPVSVRAISGANQVRVRFGYADYGTVGTNFYCTSRAEDCVTDASLSPYAFVGDSLTPTTCTSGTCTVYIPAIPGRVLVYRVERLNSGSVVSTGALEFKAIQ